MYQDALDQVPWRLADLRNVVVKVTTEIRYGNFLYKADIHTMLLEILPDTLDHLFCFTFYHDGYLTLRVFIKNFSSRGGDALVTLSDFCAQQRVTQR